jgi:hypothetical protein
MSGMKVFLVDDLANVLDSFDAIKENAAGGKGEGDDEWVVIRKRRPKRRAM